MRVRLKGPRGEEIEGLRVLIPVDHSGKATYLDGYVALAFYHATRRINWKWTSFSCLLGCARS